MCVCMDGPARVSVMYLYMILPHTYIKLYIPYSSVTAKNYALRCKCNLLAMNFSHVTSSLFSD